MAGEAPGAGGRVSDDGKGMTPRHRRTTRGLPPSSCPRSRVRSPASAEPGRHPGRTPDRTSSSKTCCAAAGDDDPRDRPRDDRRRHPDRAHGRGRAARQRATSSRARATRSSRSGTRCTGGVRGAVPRRRSTTRARTTSPTQIRPLTEHARLRRPLIAAGLASPWRSASACSTSAAAARCSSPRAVAGWLTFNLDLPMCIHMPVTLACRHRRRRDLGRHRRCC